MLDTGVAINLEGCGNAEADTDEDWNPLIVLVLDAKDAQLEEERIRSAKFINMREMYAKLMQTIRDMEDAPEARDLSKFYVSKSKSMGQRYRTIPQFLSSFLINNPEQHKI